MPLTIYYPECISFGNRVDEGEHAVICGDGGVVIGNDVLIPTGAVIASQGNPINLPRLGRNISNPISIGSEVWIGTNAVVAGIPARIIRAMSTPEPQRCAY